MNINLKAKEFATYIKSTDEFRNMNKCKNDLEKNRSAKRQFDNYISKKNTLFSNYTMEDASRKLQVLNKEYETFFNSPLVANYLESTKQFNYMMETLYKTIEKELLK
ncbi:MAG: YlbF family regulator [Peptostreptococcaceae bacterium]